MAAVIGDAVIQREAEYWARRHHFKNVRVVINYVTMTDRLVFAIVADNSYYSCECGHNDLHGSLDDFSNKYIQKGLLEIINSKTQYDDCGQII